jgi:hypothetical protein
MIDMDAITDLVARYRAIVAPSWFARESGITGYPVDLAYADIVTGGTVWIVTDRPGAMVALLAREARPGAMIRTRRFYGAEARFGEIELHVLAGSVPETLLGLDDSDESDESDEFDDSDESDE